MLEGWILINQPDKFVIWGSHIMHLIVLMYQMVILLIFSQNSQYQAKLSSWHQSNVSVIIYFRIWKSVSQINEHCLLCISTSFIRIFCKRIFVFNNETLWTCRFYPWTKQNLKSTFKATIIEMKKNKQFTEKYKTLKRRSDYRTSLVLKWFWIFVQPTTLKWASYGGRDSRAV
jgi:hypothetical protein